MPKPPVKITVELDEPHAWHLAQFLKRVMKRALANMRKERAT